MNYNLGNKKKIPHTIDFQKEMHMTLLEREKQPTSQTIQQINLETSYKPLTKVKQLNNDSH